MVIAPMGNKKFFEPGEHGGRGGIRTLGPRLKGQFFSKESRSATPALFQLLFNYTPFYSSKATSANVLGYAIQ